jgi:hypothetical protein
VYGVRHAAELRATAAEARRAGGGSSPRQLSRGVPGGRPPGQAERAAGVSSPGQLSRGPGAPGVVPRESAPGSRPPGLTQRPGGRS